MAGTSKFRIKSQTKSISLPCRSHPTTFEIEQLIYKIKITTLEAPSGEAICSGLSQLSRLYKCMNDLLTSSATQVLMSRVQNKKWVDELVEESERFLDISGSINDMMSSIKDHSRDLSYSLRRKKGELSIENSITKYNCFRKKMRKDVRGLVASLKRVHNTITSGVSVVVDSDNNHLAAVIRAVMEVGEMTISVFESLLMFFSVPVSKPNKWSLVVSKLKHKGMVACEDQQEKMVVNELGSIDVALRRLCKYGSISKVGNVPFAECRLERLEAQIERMESGLECVYRCLVQTRVSLLNIISQ